MEYIKESAIYDLEQEYTRLGLPSYGEIKYAVKQKRPETVNFLTGNVITVVEFYSVTNELWYSIDFCIQINIFKGFLIFCKTFWFKAAKKLRFLAFSANFQILKSTLSSWNLNS